MFHARNVKTQYFHWLNQRWSRIDQSGNHMKINFEYFQIQKLMLQTLKAEKGDEKNWQIP